jgi:hypothetical protein
LPGSAASRCKLSSRWRPWAAGAARDRTTWYQPLDDPADIRLAVHGVLAQPGLFLNSVGDVGLLPQVLRAAAELGTDLPDDAAMARMRERAGLASIVGSRVPPTRPRP